MTEKRENPFDLQLQNDIYGLMLINRWGWMRPTELGRYMWWSSADRGRKQACAQCSKWVERGLVLQRKLPQRAGYCYVLAQAGVNFLRENGHEAVTTGKDIGRGSGDNWLPPSDWKHQLLTLGVVSVSDQSHNKNMALPDVAIKRMNLALNKMPDALCHMYMRFHEEMVTLWLETENARKTKGKDLDKIITAFQQIAGGALTIAGFNPKAIGIIYDKANKVNHRLRMTNLLKSRMQVPIVIYWIECTTKMHAVVNASVTRELIQPEELSRYIREINAYGWTKNQFTGKDEGELQSRKIILWSHVDGTMRIQLDDERYCYEASNKTAAIQRIAERYIERAQEIRKFGRITEGETPQSYSYDDQ